MQRIVIALLALLPSAVAHADCQAGIAVAMQRASAQPPSAGRAAMFEQIQRAEVARHEDDEAECLDQLRDATSVLDQVDAAKRREATHAGHADEGPAGTAKPAK